MHYRRSIVAAVFALLACAFSLNSVEPQDDTGLTTLKTESRLVLLDVVVRDGSGKTIRGLRPQDFAVFEDEKPQQIRFFDAHLDRATPAETPGTTAATEKKLPPNQYNNLPETESASTVNVILFDMLNTPTVAQVEARNGMLDFLRHMHYSGNTAIFTLGARLQALKGFSENRADLIKSVEAMFANPSTMLTDEAQRQSDEDDLRRLELANAMHSGPPATGGKGGNINLANLTGAGRPSSSVLGSTDRMREANGESQSFRTDTRVRRTLEAFNAIARAVAGYPGRKNLLWLSGGFPFSLGPRVDLQDHTRSMRNYGALVRETALQLASSRIAVYPIDASGLQVGGIAMSSSGVSSVGFADDTGPQISTTLSRQQDDRFETHKAMDDIADQTGGHAFYDTNGISGALSRVVERDAQYYTLAYVPQNHSWDGKFRKLDVKLTRSSGHLEYRRGYFANADQNPTKEDPKQLLIRAVQPWVPNATMLLFLAQVLPPAKEHQPVKIDFVVDPRQLGFEEDSKGTKRDTLEFLSVAWDKDNEPAATSGNTLVAKFNPQEFGSAVKTGVRLHQELSLKPGSYRLRMAVVDRRNLNLGTLDVPITVSEANASR